MNAETAYQVRARLGFTVQMNSAPVSHTSVTAARRMVLLSALGTGALIGMFLLLAVVIVTAGAVLMGRELDTTRAAIQNELKAISDLKVAQIAEWRSALLRDGRQLSHSLTLSEDLAAYLARPKDARTGERMSRWLMFIQEGQWYESVMVLDSGMNLRLNRGKEPAAPNAQLQALREAMLTDGLGEIVLTDLQLTPSGSAYMEMLVPLFTRDGKTRSLLVMQIDPARFLYPLIQTWPTPSATAETLLVRRENSEVLFLNELRHRYGTTLTLRFPLDSPSLPAARAARGESGTIEGRDYRDVPVLSAYRAVPESPWFIVAKVDQAEIYAPLRSKAWTYGIAVVMLLLVTGLSLSLIWRQRVVAASRLHNAELEGRVRERTGQLEIANQELQAFSYSVSHDLRAPLRGVDGWSLALLEDYGAQLDDTAKGYLQTIRSETQRMGQLIDDLLVLSRVSRGELKREQVDLSALAHSVARRLEQAQPGRRIEFDIAPGLTAAGDARLLEIVLTNLFENAIKFTGPRASARIEFGCEKQVDAVNEGRRNVFFVRDNGVGFDMIYAQKLFGAFQRMHKASEFPGTGIGLATVQRIVHRHDGRIWAESKADHGATFYFTLAEE